MAVVLLAWLFWQLVKAVFLELAYWIGHVVGTKRASIYMFLLHDTTSDMFSTS